MLQLLRLPRLVHPRAFLPRERPTRLLHQRPRPPPMCPVAIPTATRAASNDSRATCRPQWSLPPCALLPHLDPKLPRQRDRNLPDLIHRPQCQRLRHPLQDNTLRVLRAVNATDPCMISNPILNSRPLTKMAQRNPRRPLRLLGRRSQCKAYSPRRPLFLCRFRPNHAPLAHPIDPKHTHPNKPQIHLRPLQLRRLLQTRPLQLRWWL